MGSFQVDACDAHITAQRSVALNVCSFRSAKFGALSCQGPPLADSVENAMTTPQNLNASELADASRVLATAENRPDGWISAAAYDKAVSVSAERVAASLTSIENAHLRLGGIDLVQPPSERYPRLLAATGAGPQLLFVRGSLPPDPGAAVAVVGSRRGSSQALNAARSLSAELAGAGAVVVSGLAAGVDTAAHLGALDADGVTTAVLGTGICVTYPSQNAELAERIVTAGAIVSQFPPNARPSKTSFPARNAVTAGLSHASVVIEADERSGTRIEMGLSLRFGRPVLLWAPIMASRRWAATLVEQQPDVHMVDSASQILRICRNGP